MMPASMNSMSTALVATNFISDTANLLTMSSREIAELTGSTHDNVLKTIRALVAKGVVSGNETPYVHPQNGQTYKEFRLGYRDTMVVVSGYSVELRARIIDRWQQLEEQARDPMRMLNDPAAMRGILLTYTEKVIALEDRVKEMEPEVAAYERIAVSDGSLCITDAAKTLQVQPKALFAFLKAHGWIYTRQGDSSYIAYQSKLQAGLLEHKTTVVTRSDGSEKTTTQVRVTPKGLARLAKEFPPVAKAA